MTPRSPVIAIAAASTASTTAFFVMFPLLPIYFTGAIGLDATTAGLLLGLRLLLEQGSSPLGGAAADRLGYKNAMLVGIAIRVGGFALIGFATDVTGVIVAILVAATGGALFTPSSRAVISHLVPPHRQQDAYSTVTSSWWIGQTVGPLLGALLVTVSFQWVTTAAAIGMAFALVPIALLLPATPRVVRRGVGLRGSMIAPLRDRDFRLYLGPHLLVWGIGAQIMITLPLLASSIGGPQAVGLVFGAQAVTSLVLQIPLVRFFGPRLSPLSIMCLSALVTSVSLFGFGVANSVVQLAVLGALMGIGQSLLYPNQAYVVARFAGLQGGAYFGIAGLAQGIGGAIGNASGGALIDLGSALRMPSLVWLIVGTTSLIAALGYVLFGRSPHIRERLRSRRAPEALPTPPG